MAPEAVGCRFRLGLLALAASIATMGIGCRQPAPGIGVAWTFEPVPPVTGADTIARFTLEDERRQRLRGARLRLEAHMSHPGMTPVTSDVTERGDGVYEAHVRFSMAGDWTLVVTGDLADGTRITEQVEIAGVRALQ
jgi:hypothetical protein